MARPDLTILLLLEDRWARADLPRGGGEPVASVGRHDAATLPGAAKAALLDEPRLGRQVYILSDRVWLGEVDLPASAVVGLTDAQLSEPAAYESEASGGLAPAGAVTSVKRARVTDRDDRFVVTQLSKTDLIDLAKVVSSRGGRRLGLSHPAGLAQRLNQAGGEGASWARIEFWDEETVVVLGHMGGVEVYPTGVPPTADWRRAVRNALQMAGVDPGLGQSAEAVASAGVQPAGGPVYAAEGGLPAARWASPNSGQGEDRGSQGSGLAGGLADGLADGAFYELADDATLRRFAASYALALGQAEPACPVLTKPKVSAGPVVAVCAGVLALVLAVGLVVVLHLDRQSRLAELQQAYSHVQGEQKELVDLRNATRAAAKDVQTKQRALDQLHQSLRLASQSHAERGVAGQDMRPRLKVLLTAIGDASGDRALAQGFAVESIQPAPPALLVRGVATTPTTATTLAAWLDGRLDGSWRIHAPELTPQSGTGGVVWRFSLRVEPMVKPMVEPLPATQPIAQGGRSE